MFRGRGFSSLTVFSLLLFIPSPASAQVATADLLGTISDKSSAVITGAHITAENIATHEKRMAESDASGGFVISLLPPGAYRVVVEASGFKSYTVREINLAAGDRGRVDTQMEVGATQQTVEVTAITPALQTDSSSLGQTVTNKAVQDLPLNGRNFIQLAQVTAGANEGLPNGLSTGNRPDDRRQTSSVSVNGQSSNVNNEMVDGMDNNERKIGTIGVRPSIDAISEFRVQTNLYTAEVGRTAGGVINILTKSGSNSLHGSAFEFLRNDTLDANNFFANRNGQGIAEYRQNQFGGSVGGPIKKDKTFFFADYEALRIVQGIVSTTTVPTAAMKLGNYAGVAHIYDPTSSPRTEFPNDVIPTNRLDPIALRYTALFPAPTAPGLANNYTSAQNRTQFSHTGDARIDHHFRDSDTLFGRYTVNDVGTFTPGILPPINGIQPGGNLSLFSGTSTVRAQNGQLNYVHVFRPTLLMELKASYLRINNLSLPLNYMSNLAQQFGLTGANIDPTSSILSPMVLSPYATVGDGQYLPLHTISNTFQYVGSLTWIRGSHSLKFGGGLVRRQESDFQQVFPAGQYTFNASLTNNPITDPSAGNSMASFLLGYPSQLSRFNLPVTTAFRTWEPSAYVQDDWRVKPWLTLNLGVRYDIFTPYSEAHNQLSNLNLSTYSMVLAGQNGTNSHAGVRTDYSNFAPRIGFAATLGKGTVVRGGYGISYWPDSTGTSLLKNQPFTSSYTLVSTGSSGLVPNLQLSSGVPLPAAPILNPPMGNITLAENFNFRSAYIHQFNFTIEKEFSRNVVSLGYVGELGRHQMIAHPIDQPLPGPGAVQPRRPYNAQLPLVTGITYYDSDGVTSYNALQASVQRRYSKGLTLGSNFTWSHGVGDIVTIGGSTSQAYGELPDIAHNDRGNNDIDIRLRWALMANYELPFGRSFSGVRKIVAGGWQINSLAVWATGLPFTVINSSPLGNTGGSDRPNVTGSPSVADRTVNAWFNTAAFSAQPIYTIGTAGRNIIAGPPQRHLDLSLFKDFVMGERARLQFRAEAFNITNTPSFAAPNAGRGVAAFGTISSIQPGTSPRQVQLALKLLF